MRTGFLWITLITFVFSVPAFAGTVTEELAERLGRGVESPATKEDARSLDVLAPFYGARAMAPLWVSEQGASERARTLARTLALADRDGLDPEDYGAQAIAALLNAKRPELLAQLELRLSLGLMQLASDLGRGRTSPLIADPKLYPYREEVDRGRAIRGAAEADDLVAYLRSYQPQTPRYDRLKTALADYRVLAARGGWAPIARGPSLKPGMTDSRVAPLRVRLRLWGDLKEADDRAKFGGDPSLYDDAMVEAVERMQYRHGLGRDGVVGPATLAALNVPVEDRIEQLILNLERRRWMPDDLGQRYIFVNLADFVLKLVDEPKTLLDLRVVVGKTYHMTPVFSAEMTYIEINPFWNVPRSIARKEILPKIRQDVSYLAKHNFTLFSDWGSDAKIVDPLTIEWALAKEKSFAFKLRQGSGDGNALGRLKFMFPNRFSIYLHDTPAKSLFKKASRDFSHGCIRVEDPVSLAEAVLAETPGWPREGIEQTIDSGKRQVVTLSKPLPVHISYLTAFVNKDGSVHFRGDIYKRDERLGKALLGARVGRASI